MVDSVPFIERLEEYRACARELHVDMDVVPRAGLHFDREVYFDPNKDDLLNYEKEICMVDTKAYLHQELLIDATL